MSIGNLKDSGNQGNNLPWQWKVLQGLQAILDETSLPLTCAEDSIKICDANGDILGVNSDGSIDVSVIKAVGTYLEDSRHATGDRGSFILAVRNDLNAAMTSDNSDYSPVAVNANGAVAINDGGNSITVDGTVELGATTLTALETITVQNLGGASAVNIQDGGNSITVDGGTGISRTPNAIRPTGTSGTITGNIYSISVANVGAANGTVLSSLTTIKPGEVLNFSADAINNYFTSFAYDASTTEFIIIYVA
jgi:hypothetical protein